MGGEFFHDVAKDSSVTPVFEVFHELGENLEDGTQQRTVPINQITPPKSIIFRSHVITGGARSLRSPQYLATVRRREAGRIADMIAALARHAPDEHFVVWTHEVLDRTRRLIEQLSHAEEYSLEHEGNSCEILRQLRDTLLDNGWQRYREATVRDGAIKVLRRLAAAEDVSANDAIGAMDDFSDLGLRPALGMAWSNEDEEGLPC
jgi:hypothetical protein